MFCTGWELQFFQSSKCQTLYVFFDWQVINNHVSSLVFQGLPVSFYGVVGLLFFILLFFKVCDSNPSH